MNANARWALEVFEAAPGRHLCAEQEARLWLAELVPWLVGMLQGAGHRSRRLSDDEEFSIMDANTWHSGAERENAKIAAFDAYFGTQRRSLRSIIACAEDERVRDRYGMCTSLRKLKALLASSEP